MTIAVLGAGAMGSFFGAKLSLAGFPVRFIDVNAAHIEAVRRDGLRLDTEAGHWTVEAPIGSAASFPDPVDVMIVFTKGPHTIEALNSARHLIGPHTAVVTLQNGLGAGERVAQVVPNEQVLFGVTNWPADLKGSGHVSSHGEGEVRLWSLDDQRGPRLEAVDHMLSKAGLNSQIDPTVLQAVWAKVAFNAAMNSIAAVTGFTVGEMADDPDVHALALAVAREVVSVAHARGAPVAEARVIDMVEHAFAEHRSHKPSMLQDILAGRSTEIDSINGAVVEEAAKAGVTAPVVQTLLRLVRAKQMHIT
jgi:2-dehydropantoate 2-reductase